MTLLLLNFQILQKYITQGIESGIVKPLIRVVFSLHQVNQAFRTMSSNKHTGKVLVRIKDPSIMSNGLETIPRYVKSNLFNFDATKLWSDTRTTIGLLICQLLLNYMCI